MKKKLIAIILTVCLLISFGVRLFVVNHDVEKTKILKYSKNEVVPVGKNFFDKADEIVDGYTVKVLDSWIVPTKQYLVEKGEREDLIDTSIMQYIYMVKVEFVNEYNDFAGKKGIDLQRYMLRGTDYILTPNGICFKMANDNGVFNGNMKFSLNKNRPPFEIILTFGVYEGVATIEHIKSDIPNLQICTYPELKLISIK